MRTNITWTDQALIDLDVTAGNLAGMTVGCVETDEGCIKVVVVGDGTAVDVCADERIADAEGVADTAEMVVSTKTAHAGVALDARGVEGLISLINRAYAICQTVATTRIQGRSA